MIKYCIGLLVMVCCVGVVDAQTTSPFYYDPPPAGNNTQAGNIKDEVKSAVLDDQGPIQRLIALFLPNRPKGEGVVQFIQYVLNIALSLVAFIAILVLIYGFYGILFGDTQEGIENARKTVRGAAIAIVVMGASWLIVQAMFYIITLLQ